MFRNDPFRDNIITTGENLIKQLSDDKNGKWHDITKK